MSVKPLYISYYVRHKTSENTLQFYSVCNIFKEEETRKMTLEKALEISQNIIVEKTTYLNTLEYEAQRMKETDLHAASIEAELKKTREEIAAMEIVNGRLQVYRNVAQQEGVRR